MEERSELQNPTGLQSLSPWGWTDYFTNLLTGLDSSGLIPARVIDDQRGRYGLTAVLTEAAEASRPDRPTLFGRPAGGLDRWPVIGDWVLVRPPAGDGDGLISAILEPKTVLQRTSVDSKRRSGAGRTTFLAANVDLVLAVSALDRDYNLRRLERYLALAWEGGAEPVVVLNKADIRPDAGDLKAEAELSLPGVTVIALSARTGEGLAELTDLLAPGRTAVLVGSSGVGKSSLINRLAGEEVLATGRTRTGDSKGRHTTTSRKLIRLASGALVIDTPGLRALGLTQAEAGLARLFGDIQDLAQGCRFSDCSHQGEPGCAVARAVAENNLDPDRLASYLSLEKESRARATAADPQARRKAGREMSQKIKEAKKFKGGF